MRPRDDLTPASLAPKLDRFWELSERKILDIDRTFEPTRGAPVFTVEGRYTTRGWTEWTEGFAYGSAVLQFDATGDEAFVRLARERIVARMASHVTHTGVHDHGFNNLSTYGALLRLVAEERIPADPWEVEFHRLALRASAAVQASRWTTIPGGGYVYSFNGPHSLFVDTVRSCRILMVGHLLGHQLMGDSDERISLLERAVHHLDATARFNVYYGDGRDAYDVRGRVAHEAVFNTNDGSFRCPNSQQGYSGFTTWTRGLAWAMLGYAEELELLPELDDRDLEPVGGRAAIEQTWLRAARATCDFWIENTPTCGVPYWDTGAPRLHELGDYLERPADPFNEHEPVDSSAAAIAAQGLLRLGRVLDDDRYVRAGLTVADTLLSDPYLSVADDHQGLILHSVYHRPNGWDHVPAGRAVPCGESSMWGDYHARELALYVQRLAAGGPYPTFFAGARA